EKVIDVNLERLRKTLTNHSDIKYSGEIYFHGELAHQYTSTYEGKLRRIICDKQNRFYVITDSENPVLLEITPVMKKISLSTRLNNGGMNPRATVPGIPERRKMKQQEREQNLASALQDVVRNLTDLPEDAPYVDLNDGVDY